MALSNKTLAELAYLNAAVGPVKTEQGDSPVAGANGAPAVNGDGVDVEDAVYAVVRVNPTGGSPSFRIYSRGIEETDEFSLMNNLEDLSCTDGKAWKEIVFVGPEAEVGIEVTAMGGASSVELTVSPCFG